jgi:hypothetical protein
LGSTCQRVCGPAVADPREHEARLVRRARTNDSPRRRMTTGRMSNRVPHSFTASVFISPAWLAVIVGLLAIVISAVVAVAVARWQRGPRPVTALSYRATASALVSTKPAGRLKILYEERELRQGGLIAVGLRNSGSQPIPKEAFDGPLSVEFGPNAEIVMSASRRGIQTHSGRRSLS